MVLTAAFQWRLKFSSSFTLELLNDPSTLLRFAANTIGRLCTHLVMMFISLCCADIAIYFDRWLASKSYILSAAGLVRNRHHLIGSLPDGTNLPLDDKVDLGTASIQCF